MISTVYMSHNQQFELDMEASASLDGHQDLIREPGELTHPVPGGDAGAYSPTDSGRSATYNPIQHHWSTPSPPTRTIFCLAGLVEARMKDRLDRRKVQREWHP